MGMEGSIAALKEKNHGYGGVNCGPLHGQNLESVGKKFEALEALLSA